MTNIKYDLSDVTFITALRIDCDDRAKNLETTISYLCKHFNTNIFVLEADSSPKCKNFLSQFENVSYFFEESSCLFFHRTKFLNKLLKKVKTKIVVNYDIDILLPINAYLECRDKINSGYDLVYPYFYGDSQYKVEKHNVDKQKFEKSLDLNDLQIENLVKNESECGHAQFFNTRSYVEGYMENENFISYGPEDKERLWRFFSLGYKISWNTNHVYHLEHERVPNSFINNPFYICNILQYNKLLNLFHDKTLAKKLMQFEKVNPLSVTNYVDPQSIKKLYSSMGYVNK
jgi:hypothetical protein